MNIPVLFFGNSFDGPVATPTLPFSVEEAFETFGGYVYEDHTISATATGITASEEVFGTVSFYTWEDDELIPFTDICSVVASGTSITFERIGTDQNLTIKYTRAMPTGSALLYKAYSEAFRATGNMPYLYRVGGTPAATQVVSGGVGLEFTTIGEGTLYNQAAVSVTSTGFTVTQPPGKGMPYTYATSGKEVAEIAEDVNLRYMKGYGCVICEAIGSGSFAVSAQNYPLSGGTDGSYTDEELVTLFEGIDLSGICAVSILGKAYPVSGDPGVLGDILTSEFLDDTPNPIMFVQNMQSVSGMAAEDYVALLEANKPINHRNVMLVTGQSYHTDDIHEPYIDGLAPVMAASLPYAPHTLFWNPISVSQITPSFDTAKLVRLRAAGYVAFGTHYTRPEPFIASDTASDPDWDSRKYLAVMDTVATVRPYLDSLIGTRPTEAELVKQNILQNMASIPNLQEYTADVTIYRNGLVNVALMIRPFASIEAISFSVSVNT